MEIGGLLTVDAANKVKDWENTPAQLGTVELSALVHVDSNMQASITLVSDPDPSKIAIDQAIGEWTLSRGKIIFGQMSYNFGLLSTRTISDPLILELGNIHHAGISGLMESGPMTYGLGLTTTETMDGKDSITASDPTVILNTCYATESQMTHLGLQLSRQQQAIDLATNLSYSDFLIDIEGIWRWKDQDKIAKGGVSVGLAWNFNSLGQVALRWDAMGPKEDYFESSISTLGLTFTPMKYVFVACELNRDQDGEMSFALQMGLQSTLKLPGFQRKTLTKE